MNQVRAKLQANFDTGQDLIFSGVKTGSMLVCRPCDSTSANLNKTTVKEKSRCLSGNRLSFSELFNDISLVLNLRILCVVVDSRISAAIVCDFVISAWC